MNTPSQTERLLDVEAETSEDITDPLLSGRVPDEELVQFVLVLHCLGHEGRPDGGKK